MPEIKPTENQMKLMEMMVKRPDWTVSLSGLRLARKTAKGMLRREYAIETMDNQGKPALKLTTYGRQIYRSNIAEEKS